MADFPLIGVMKMCEKCGDTGMYSFDDWTGQRWSVFCHCEKGRELKNQYWRSSNKELNEKC